MEQKITEQQLVQMAQQEEAVLKSKQRFLREISKIIKDSAKTIDALKEIKKNPEKMYMNLGAGVLIEVEVKNTEKCKRAFAENGYVEETIQEAIKWIEKRKDNGQKQLEKIGQDATQSEARLNEIIGILRQIENKKRKQFNISKK